jgi:hypothetical protein
MTSAPPGSDAPTRRLVLVVSIGRSGTSLFTGILRQLGFRVPQPEVRADETNPRGFNEPRWVVDFHTRLMRDRRVTIFDARPAAWQMMAETAEDEAVVGELTAWLAVQFVGTENVVVKDPRIGWFLPLWRRCADDLAVEISFTPVLRHPAHVITSARASYGTWQTDASRAAAWLNVSLHMEAETRNARRAFVCYDDVLANWSREISRVGELLDAPCLVHVDGSRRRAVDGFVDPKLRRSVVGWDTLAVPAPLVAMLEEGWERLSALAQGRGETAGARAALDELRSAYVQLYADVEAIAQSSVRASEPRAGRKWATGEARRTKAGRASWRMARGLVRCLPARQREQLGSAVSEGLLADGVGGVPLRVALLVPPRYRERLPLPLVRAGLRVVRALRR